MSNELGVPSPEELMENFEKEKFYFSYSSLTRLMNDPLDFYHKYVLGQWDEEETKNLRQGQLFHCLLLEPENFEEKFIVGNKQLPTQSVINVVTTVYKNCVEHKIKENPGLTGTFALDAYRQQILQVLEDIDLYQNLTDSKRKDAQGRMLTGDEKRIEKVITPEAVDYFFLLQEGVQRTIVDLEEVVTAKEKATIMREHPQVKDWLAPQNSKIDVRKEFEHKTDIPGYSFGLKGIIDMLHIDMENETISIIDFKTNGRTLQEWYESFETSKYMYWMQPIIYKELIMSLVPEKSKDEWKMKVYYPVIDKNNKIYIFPVAAESLREWEKKTKAVLDMAEWHMQTKNFDLPFEFAKGLISL